MRYNILCVLLWRDKYRIKTKLAYGLVIWIGSVKVRK